jgi:hypothetical protein
MSNKSTIHLFFQKNNTHTFTLCSFSHPDYTVGSRFSLDPPLAVHASRVTDLKASALSPPVGNFTLPRRISMNYEVFLATILSGLDQECNLLISEFSDGKCCAGAVIGLDREIGILVLSGTQLGHSIQEKRYSRYPKRIGVQTSWIKVKFGINKYKICFD